MKASEWRKQLPENLCAAQDAILAALMDPSLRAPIDWVGLPVSHGEHSGVVYVATDALKVGEPADQVRVCLDCLHYQMACDALGLQMPTAKLLDLVYAARQVRVSPCTFCPDSNGNVTVTDPSTGAKSTVSMLSVTAMFAHDARVSGAQGGFQGLICNSGKGWFICKNLGSAHPQGGWRCANYGWYDASAPYVSVQGQYKLWQPLSTAHNEFHVDYSQVVYAWHPIMMVDGIEIPTADVLRNPALAPMVSHEGALPFSRHPRLAAYEPEGGVVLIAPALSTVPLLGGKTTMTDGPYQFVQARNFTRTDGNRCVDLIVLHTIEAAEKPGTALGVARWFAGEAAPKASAHYCIDSDTVVQCVYEGDVAWGAPGANHDGVHIEHAGYAAQSAAQWDDKYSRAMLVQSAQVAAGICARHAVPVEFVDAEDLLEQRRGITTHREVTKACQLAKSRGMAQSPFYKAQSDHTDPGVCFPMREYLQLILSCLPVAAEVW